MAETGPALLPLQTVADEAVKLSGGKSSRVVAAFVTRMMAYRSEGGSRVLPRDAVATVHSFQSSDHASSHTVRMQVAFETAYSEAHIGLERRRRARQRKLQELGVAIASVTALGTADLATLSTVYKQISAYVTTFLSADLAAAGLKPAAAATEAGGVVAAQAAAQQEIQAAMESVFPRVGVKQFTGLSADNKRAQLEELAHLVLGIRLFNWGLGKGGAGIEDTPQLAAEEAGRHLKEAERTLTLTNDACQAYVDVLLAVRGEAVRVPGGIGGVWASELANRRQLSVYLASLIDDLRVQAAAIEEAKSAFSSEMGSLRELIGGRATVSKEAVYPKFHSLAAHWLRCAELRDGVRSAADAHTALFPFTHTTGVPPEVVRTARLALSAGSCTGISVAPPSDATAAAAATWEGDPDDRPLKLSLEHSPEFLQLPLEYQGYCPVTLTVPVTSASAGGGGGGRGVSDDGMGILLAGDPSIAVVRWRQRHFVCADAAAAAAFFTAPDYFVSRVRSLALRNVELVHLLQLLSVDGFPEASIPALVQYDGDIGAAAAAVGVSLGIGTGSSGGGGGGMGRGSHAQAGSSGSSTGTGEGKEEGVRLSRNGRVLVDKAVETPTHFVERHIDPHYEWNEWVLRRRALAIVHLLQCKTSSAQTDASAFRRDGDTQVYLPVAASTQTGINASTNTTGVKRYFGGLRGAREGAVEDAASRAGIPHAAHLHPAASASSSSTLRPAFDTIGTASGGRGAGGAGGGIEVSTETVAAPGRSLQMAVTTLKMDA